MTCEEARDLLLVADPSELEGKGLTELAMHVRTCAVCRRQATALVNGTNVLRFGAVRRAEQRVRRAHRIVAFAASAAAASVVLAIVAKPNREEATDVGRPVASLPVARHVSLEVGRGQRATVLKTNDPKVTVIWLSAGEGR